MFQGWQVADAKKISLEEVVRNAKITVLIGVAGKAGMFTEDAVRAMTKNTERPMIFPLSNPTSKSEATPADLLKWTDGKALIGTGSPFEPVKVGRSGNLYRSDEQFVYFSGAGAGDCGGQVAAGDGRDVHDGGADTGGPVAGGKGSQCELVAAAGGFAEAGPGDCGGGGTGGDRGGAVGVEGERG